MVIYQYRAPLMVTHTAPATPAAEAIPPPMKKAKVGDEERPPSSISSGAVIVFNTQRKKFHKAEATNILSVCGWWTCGTAARPADNAIFNYSGNGSKCTKCFCQ